MATMVDPMIVAPFTNAKTAAAIAKKILRKHPLGLQNFHYPKRLAGVYAFLDEPTALTTTPPN